MCDHDVTRRLAHSFLLERARTPLEIHQITPEFGCILHPRHQLSKHNPHGRHLSNTMKHMKMHQHVLRILQSLQNLLLQNIQPSVILSGKIHQQNILMFSMIKQNIPSTPARLDYFALNLMSHVKDEQGDEVFSWFPPTSPC